MNSMSACMSTRRGWKWLCAERVRPMYRDRVVVQGGISAMVSQREVSGLPREAKGRQDSRR